MAVMVQFLLEESFKMNLKIERMVMNIIETGLGDTYND